MRVGAECSNRTTTAGTGTVFHPGSPNCTVCNFQELEQVVARVGWIFNDAVSRPQASRGVD